MKKISKRYKKLLDLNKDKKLDSVEKIIDGQELQVQVAASGHYIAEVKRKFGKKDYYFTVSDKGVHRLTASEKPFDINNRNKWGIKGQNPKIVYVLLKKKEEMEEIEGRGPTKRAVGEM